jgi:NAD(P)H-dependent flavin oxidoreductase YrpB (nitropropane dioxygenase family)
MGTATTAPLVAAVSNAGGFGTLGTSARAVGDTDNATLSFGQDAGLIDSIQSVKEVVQEIVTEAEKIIKDRLPSLLRQA